MPLIDADGGRAVEVATEVIAAFSHQFDRHWLAGMRAKLGLLTRESGDFELVRSGSSSCTAINATTR